MKEKGIKAKDVKNLPPIEEIHGLDPPPPPKVVEVNSLMKFNDNDNPHNVHPRQCLYEFENYIRKQNNFNANVMNQLKYNSDIVATRPEWIKVSVLKCHPWISMLTHTVLED